MLISIAGNASESHNNAELQTMILGAAGAWIVPAVSVTHGRNGVNAVILLGKTTTIEPLDKNYYLIRLLKLSNGKPNWQRSEAT